MLSIFVGVQSVVCNNGVLVSGNSNIYVYIEFFLIIHLFYSAYQERGALVARFSRS